MPKIADRVKDNLVRIAKGGRTMSKITPAEAQQRLEVAQQTATQTKE